jgi:DNA/RNA-binding domain of Phe-tRNA-synthetase-like protein
MHNLKMTDQLPLKLAYFFLTDTTVTASRQGYTAMEALGHELRQRYADTPIAHIPGVSIARQMFHDLVIDPTRRRPSSEALLRRAINAKGFFAVNSHVDIGNWCSLEFLLPVCLYDISTLQAPVVLRRGTAEDAYEAINHRLMQFEGKPVLADVNGAFGSPLTDSLRGCVTTQTTDILCCIWGAASNRDDELTTCATIFSQRLKTAGGGTSSLPMLCST